MKRLIRIFINAYIDVISTTQTISFALKTSRFLLFEKSQHSRQ